ncbi:hypothetical protein IQ249_14000 [Lusitaniella coriacea LEGE 07157]|uniref:Uncharacterized protein n=1 Tax=Lusitaniella coriacea LEGE 07157 TaxID=945747 RepID=A0A8J7DXJ3_9CYAN|nr:hypothetical protein [Lusitaniella coriacea]MBE9117012.1 hypothetical protein [Lusitaniella coriacea LEGE 07157]
MSNQKYKLLAFFQAILQPLKPKNWLFLFLLLGCFLQIRNSTIQPQKAWAQSQKDTSMSEENASEERYQVIGNRQGKVTVKDARSGEIIRVFQMEEGVIVRETFVLDYDQIIAASQKDKTIFWNLETGQEIARLDQRVHSFSDDRSRFISFGSNGLLVSSYPELTTICQLSEEPSREGTKGLAQPEFSPNNRYLEVNWIFGKPAADEDYPVPGTTGIGGRLPGFRELFDLEVCRAFQGFPQMRNILYPGRFSSDSRYYFIEEAVFFFGDRLAEGTIQFNLKTYEAVQIPQLFDDERNSR